METIRCYNFKPNCFSQTKIAGCIFYSFVCRFCKNNCKRIAIFLGLFLCFALMVFFPSNLQKWKRKIFAFYANKKWKRFHASEIRIIYFFSYIIICTQKSRFFKIFFLEKYPIFGPNYDCFYSVTTLQPPFIIGAMISAR